MSSNKATIYGLHWVGVGWSIHPLSEIRRYWSSKPFLGIPEFCSVMSRWQFQIIRGSHTYRPPGLDSPNVKVCKICRLKTCVASAMVSGICSYDETIIRSKARCVAATSLPTKLLFQCGVVSHLPSDFL
jgi:hypothetical protein